MSKSKIIHIQKSDDITSVTEAIKAASSSSVRLVSDTGSTVLKSATNIKLIKKIADKNRKQIIFVNPHTSVHPVLVELKLRASKTTSSNPYTVEADTRKIEKKLIIESPEPVEKKVAKSKDSEDDPIDQDEAEVESGSELNDELKEDEKKLEKLTAKKSKSSGISIPNFEKFRNKTLLVGFGFISLIIGWFVAFKVLPNGLIQLRLQTDKVGVQETITISNTFSGSNLANNQIKAQRATVEKTISQEVTASGEKNVGEKAVGTVLVSNLNSDTTENFQAGTRFQTSDGLIFIADEAFSVDPASIRGGSIIPGTGIAQVAAGSEGEEYNVDSGSSLSIINGSGTFTAEIDEVDGGTTEEVSILSESDVNEFTETLNKPASADIEAELQRQFDQTMLVLDDTSSVEIINIVSDPEVGEETEKAKVTVTVTYSVFAISKEDIENLAKEKVKLDPSGGEKIYSVDTNSVVAKTTDKIENGLVIDVSIDSFIGPELDEVALSKEIEGMKFSDALDLLRSKPGIVDAQIELSPFWVNSIPGVNDLAYEVEVAEVSNDG